MVYFIVPSYRRDDKLWFGWGMTSCGVIVVIIQGYKTTFPTPSKIHIHKP